MESVPLFLVVLSLTVCMLSLKNLILVRKRSKCSAPEASGGWPVIGHLHLFAGRGKLLHRTLGHMADKHGPVFTVRLGSKRAIVISSPEIAKECFTTQDRFISSRPHVLAGKHLGYDDANFIFSPYGDYWTKMRRLVKQELLAGRGLQMIQQVFDAELNGWVKRLRESLKKEADRKPVLVNLQDMMYDLSFDVFRKVIAGNDLETFDSKETASWREVVSKLLYLTGVITFSDVFPCLLWLDRSVEKEMKKTGKDFDTLLQTWLNDHKKKRAQAQDNERGRSPDFMDLMLSMKEKGELGNLSVEEDVNIKATCQAMMVGGTDTTPSAVVWALSMLLNNQSALKKAREEIDTHVGDHRPAEGSDVEHLPYLQAVVKESMRLQPVGPVTSLRESIEDCAIGGYHVTAGTRVMINLWKIQRDPGVWSDPSAFLPERFMGPHAHVEVKGSKNSELLPFSAGRRSCPGADFAMFSVHLSLMRILHAFNLRTEDDSPVDMRETSGVVSHKVIPLKVLMYPRAGAETYS